MPINKALLRELPFILFNQVQFTRLQRGAVKVVEEAVLRGHARRNVLSWVVCQHALRVKKQKQPWLAGCGSSDYVTSRLCLRRLKSTRFQQLVHRLLLYKRKQHVKGWGCQSVRIVGFVGVGRGP